MSDFDRHRTPEEETVRSVHNNSKRNPVLTIGLSTFFSRALELFDHLEYGDPSEYLQNLGSVGVAMSPIDDTWTPPRFKQQGQEGEEVGLDILLADRTQGILVLADPGCGKSTLARFLTCTFISRFCQEEQDHFAILVPLASLRLSGMTYQEAVVNCAVRRVGLESDPEVAKDLIRNFEKCFVIFDGLDELPISVRHSREGEPPSPPTRQEAAQLVRALRFVHAPTQRGERPFRFVVTCRTRDYFEDPTSSLAPIPHYFLSRFSPLQMNAVVKKWHDAAIRRARESFPNSSKVVEALGARQRGIKSVLRDNAELGALCLTPLMLNVLQTVYSDGYDLVSSVSHLCWRAVKWFFVEKHKQSRLGTFVNQHSAWLIDALVEVAWTIQEQVAGGGTKFIADDQLRKAVTRACPKGARHYDYEEQEDAVTSVVGFIRRGHGILIQISNSEFEFAHSVFREVLAGKALARLSVPERRHLALQESWHAPIRYWAGLRAGESDGLHEISAFVGELSQDRSDVLAVLARGEMLAEVCSSVPREKLTLDLLRRIEEARADLAGSLSKSDLTLAHRFRIGDLLGTLGDPRLIGTAERRIVWIDEGQRQIGRAQNHKSRIAKYQSCPASPVTTGFLSRYGIGKYLVTNAEFADFVKAGGYKDARFWPSDYGRRWATGDRSVIDELISKAREVAPTHLSSELAGQRLVPEEIPDRCVQMIDRLSPMCWLDPSFNRPNQPVVGVNWWEAVAYCLWLNEHLQSIGALPAGTAVRLPLEAEWETAARLCGKGNMYPWLSGEPLESAHLRAISQPTFSARLLRSCAVGLFESVPTDLPLFDLAGNVWEWTASKAEPYGAASFERTVEYHGLSDRIARGSSWLSSEDEASQITFRSFDPPYNSYEDLGFRITIV